MRRQACYVVIIAIAGGTGMGVAGGSLREAIGYGAALATGTLVGFGLAKRA